jgi:uncharacterized protein (DUF433 family)
MSRRIISDPAILSGTPVFRGTRIALSHIVGMMRTGVADAEIEEDYPALSPRDLRFVRMFTRKVPACVVVDEFVKRSIQTSRKPSAA